VQALGQLNSSLSMSKFGPMVPDEMASAQVSPTQLKQYLPPST